MVVSVLSHLYLCALIMVGTWQSDEYLYDFWHHSESATVCIVATTILISYVT